MLVQFHFSSRAITEGAGKTRPATSHQARLRACTIIAEERTGGHCGKGRSCAFAPVLPRCSWCGLWSTRDEFIRRHLKTLWACDFFTKKAWTLRGLVEYYVLFFIHIPTRRVHAAGMTPNPDGVWMARQARNLCTFLEEQGDRKPTHIIRDRDSKFTTRFCSILALEGIEFREIPPLSPNLNPFAEAWVQRVKRECLDFFVVFGERHLRYILGEWLDYDHRFRPHQGLEANVASLSGSRLRACGSKRSSRSPTC